MLAAEASRSCHSFKRRPACVGLAAAPAPLCLPRLPPAARHVIGPSCRSSITAFRPGLGEMPEVFILLEAHLEAHISQTASSDHLRPVLLK